MKQVSIRTRLTENSSKQMVDVMPCFHSPLHPAEVVELLYATEHQMYSNMGHMIDPCCTAGVQLMAFGVVPS
jgi:hypothetical protein